MSSSPGGARQSPPFYCLKHAFKARSGGIVPRLSPTLAWKPRDGAGSSARPKPGADGQAAISARGFLGDLSAVAEAVVGPIQAVQRQGQHLQNDVSVVQFWLSEQAQFIFGPRRSISRIGSGSAASFWLVAELRREIGKPTAIRHSGTALPDHPAPCCRSTARRLPSCPMSGRQLGSAGGTAKAKAVPWPRRSGKRLRGGHVLNPPATPRFRLPRWCPRKGGVHGPHAPGRAIR